MERGEEREQQLKNRMTQQQSIINELHDKLNGATEKHTELAKSIKQQSSASALSTSPSIQEMDKLLNDKHDQIEDLQDSLEKANLKIQSLEVENKGLVFDLDKAEQMLEDYYEKIEE